MRCDHCGSPYEPSEVLSGTCGHCGVALPHAVRNPDETVRTRRVQEQLPSSDARANLGLIMTVTAAVVMAGAGVFAFALFRGERRSYPIEPIAVAAPTPSAVAPIAPVASEIPVGETSVPEITKGAARDAGRAGVATKGGAAPATGRSAVGQVLDAHRSAFAKCQRAERQENPSAPRRYSIAVTLAPDGRIQWFEVLSEASPTVRSCFDSTARSLTYPKPSEGNARALVTLSFPEDP